MDLRISTKAEKLVDKLPEHKVLVTNCTAKGYVQYQPHTVHNNGQNEQKNHVRLTAKTNDRVLLQGSILAFAYKRQKTQKHQHR
jgi:hypothetical protein